MRLLTFLAFVLAGSVLFFELTGKQSSVPSPGVAVSQPSTSRIAASPSSPVPAKSSVPLSSPSVISQSSDALSSALTFVKQKLSAIPSAIPGGAPAALLSKSHSRSELRIARGIVMDQVGSDLVLNCSGWIVHGVSTPTYAGDGLGMNVIYGNLVETHEQFQFGRLMTVDHGVLRESHSVFDRSMWSTASYLDGPVIVRGYPTGRATKGKGIKMVVAPEGSDDWQGSSIPVYTASFDLAD